MRNKRTVARGHTKEFTFGSVPLSSSSVLPQKTPAENEKGNYSSFSVCLDPILIFKRNQKVGSSNNSDPWHDLLPEEQGCICRACLLRWIAV
ncbi:hypothetical protein QQP08_008253 [Theobroma cacao]|nr:hypothetical protein QQP08_008253 [Theobroma cacao]